MKFTLLAFLLTFLATNSGLANDAPLVAAASSLRQVWPLLMQAYSPAEKPRATFGSSGNLTRQVLQGAPFELLLSADLAYTEALHSKGKSREIPVPYATGALAWVALPESPVAQWLQRPSIAEGVSTPFPFDNTTKLATPNPAFAPYGRAAAQVLDANGITSASNIKLALGENAAQALQFALSGATAGGIVPLSLVSGVAKEQLPTIVVREIDASLHDPLIHGMVLIKNPTPNAQQLFNFLLSDQAQRIFEQNGFRAIE